jgi:hypothetical protein
MAGPADSKDGLNFIIPIVKAIISLLIRPDR